MSPMGQRPLGPEILSGDLTPLHDLRTTLFVCRRNSVGDLLLIRFTIRRDYNCRMGGLTARDFLL